MRTSSVSSFFLPSSFGTRSALRFCFACVLLLIVCLFSGVLLANPVAASKSRDVSSIDPWVEETIRSIVDTQGDLPDGVQVVQRVTLRALIFRWVFHSDLEYGSGQWHATTYNAPSFVPEGIPAELLTLGRALDMFELQFVSYDEDQGLLLLRGPRHGYDGRGASEGLFWVDVARRIVPKAELSYSWGTLAVEQEYTSVSGHQLPHRQTARMLPSGATLEVLYSDYTFP